MQKRNQKGFTLIELLIVVAIIGLLATLAIVSLNTARQKANDTKRVADLKSTQTALELYWNGEGGGTYPALDVGAAEDWATLETTLATYLPALPIDPTAGGEYHYYFTTGGSEYVLMTTLQDDTNSALNVDIEPRLGTNVYGLVVGANGSATTSDVAAGGSGTNPTCTEITTAEYCLLSVES